MALRLLIRQRHRLPALPARSNLCSRLVALGFSGNRGESPQFIGCQRVLGLRYQVLFLGVSGASLLMGRLGWRQARLSSGDGSGWLSRPALVLGNPCPPGAYGGHAGYGLIISCASARRHRLPAAACSRLLRTASAAGIAAPCVLGWVAPEWSGQHGAASSTSQAGSNWLRRSPISRKVSVDSGGFGKINPARGLSGAGGAAWKGVRTHSAITVEIAIDSVVLSPSCHAIEGWPRPRNHFT